MFRKTFYNLLQEKRAILLFLISYLFLNIIEYKYCTNFTASAEYVTGFDLLKCSVEISIYYFVIFLIGSYLFGIQFRNSELENLVSHKKYTRIFYSNIAMILLIVFIYFVTFLSWNLAGVSKVFPLEQDFVKRITQVCVIYFFLFLVFAVVIGFYLSRLEKLRNAILIVVLIFLFVSNILGNLIQMIHPSSVLFYKIWNCFQVGPRCFNTIVDPVCGISAHYTRFFTEVFWITVVLILINKKIKMKCRGMKMGSAGLLLISLAIVLQSPYLGDESVNTDTWAMDHCNQYYNGNKQTTVPADFKILKYNMKFDFRKNLNAKVEIQVADTDLKVYRFTLHHQYKISKITNEKGELLKYDRNGDYITVSQDKMTSQIIFYYQGYAAGAYANDEWVYLESEFCYYPKAGFVSIYNMEDNHYAVDNHRDSVQYSVKINSKKPFFCNLTEKKKNEFCGTSNALTIRSGFFKAYHYRDVTVVYPYLDQKMLVGKNTIKNTVDSLYAIENSNRKNSTIRYSVKGKTIFVGIENSMPAYLFYDTHIEMHYLLTSGKKITEYANFLKNGKNMETIREQ